jgi:hypothetical protein
MRLWPAGEKMLKEKEKGKKTKATSDLASKRGTKYSLYCLLFDPVLKRVV